MSCKFQTTLETNPPSTKLACKVTCGECQFLENGYDLSCEILHAFKDLQLKDK